jgi:hypothetical protein
MEKNGPKEMRGCWKSKEEAVDGTVWGPALKVTADLS